MFLDIKVNLHVTGLGQRNPVLLTQTLSYILTT